MAVIWLALANGFPAGLYCRQHSCSTIASSVSPQSRMSCLCGACHLRNIPLSCLHRATSSWQTSACAKRAFPWPIPPARSVGRQRSVVDGSDCSDFGCEFLITGFFDNASALFFTSTWLPRSWGSSRTTTRWTGGAWGRCCMRCCMVWWVMASITLIPQLSQTSFCQVHLLNGLSGRPNTAPYWISARTLTQNKKINRALTRCFASVLSVLLWHSGSHTSTDDERHVFFSLSFPFSSPRSTAGTRMKCMTTFSTSPWWCVPVLPPLPGLCSKACWRKRAHTDWVLGMIL